MKLIFQLILTYRLGIHTCREIKYRDMRHSINYQSYQLTLMQGTKEVTSCLNK